MDITNKAIEVSNRMQEIEHQLSCNDLYARDADDLRYEYAELEDWNHLLNAYFKLRAENEALRKIVEDVAHIGVDVGYGVLFELTSEHVNKARKLIKSQPAKGE